MSQFKNVAVKALFIGFILSTILAASCYLRWRSDQASLKRLVQEVVTEGTSPSATMRAMIEYLEAEVGRDRGDAYFLVPALSFMRPTARQIIEGTGGDCAYRSRAYIVLLGLADVEASKLAVYDPSGDSVHAVVRVETERGPYIVDALFGIIHQHGSGEPISERDLADEEILLASVGRAVKSGNNRASRYPFDEYPLSDLRTLNWQKNAPLRASYKALALALGEERARRLPRPYISEEPALMLMLLASSLAAACLAGIGLVSRIGRAPRKLA